MKIWKKVLVLAMSSIIGVTCAACSGCGSKTPDIKPIATVDDKENHTTENGLHKVSVNESNRTFIADNTTEYKILVDGTEENAVTAASFVSRRLQEATGVRVAVEQYTAGKTIGSADKYVVIGCPELFEAAGLTMPTDDIGQTGYYIKSSGNSVYIAARGVHGYQNAAISFLKHTVGYEMYASDCIVYEKTGETLPDFDVVEKPDFEFHVPGNQVDDDALYGMGFLNTEDIFVAVDGALWHNSFNYLPPDDYKDEHPDWYSNAGTQLCYTAHGKYGEDDEYDKMVDTVVGVVIGLVDANPDITNVTFTQQDVTEQCGCAACSEIIDTYGSISAAIIKFCNRVNAEVQAHLQEQAAANGTAKREFNILFFAYQASEKPPVKTENGKYAAIDDSVVCDDNVGVIIAPINAYYNQSFYHEDNLSAAINIESWSACCKKLYLWLYETNYSHYFYPFNSYDTTVDTYRFCFENGAIFMFNDGQYNQANVTHFSKLKEYVDAKAEFDVGSNYNDLTDDFFKNYFRAAEAPMRLFFDELQAHMRYLESEYSTVNGNIFCRIAQSQYWPKRTLNHWLELCDEAYAAIEVYRDAEPVLYSTLKKHILIETIFPRFALIQLHGASYADNELREMRRQFRADADSLDITHLDEWTTLEETYKSWKV